MKNLMQILIFILLLPPVLLAQWFSQTSGTTWTLSGVSFVDENIGTVVGGFGTILRTTNAGENWISQTSGTNFTLTGVSFTDAANGTVVGEGGIILRTTNGGENWIIQTSGTFTSLNGVSFTDAANGTVVGISGTILRTTNGGQNWISQTSGTSNWLLGVSFTDAANGTAVGEAGIILRTTNGGQNWIDQTSGTSNWLFGVSFTDANNGTAVGGVGTILRTTNGGQNWVSQTSGITNWLNGVSFTDSNIGTVVGDEGTILRTTNGGENWISQTSGTNRTLYGVSFTDLNNGTAVGAVGKILRTNDGGIPVELTSFTATANNEEVILNWSTATETNNSGFEIQRTSPLPSPYEGEGGEAGRGWSVVAFVPGFGTTTEPKSYSFIDENLSAGTYQYRLKQIDFDGNFEYSNIVEVSFMKPDALTLEQNYPNPFNPTTTISFYLPETGFTSLEVFDILGNEVADLVNEVKESGIYEVRFDGSNLASGMYIYQLQAGGFFESKKLLLIK